MTVLVIDASVALKWFLRDRADGLPEPEADQALALLQACAQGACDVLQPVHFEVEVAAVLARLDAPHCARHLARLAALKLPQRQGPELLARALQLSIQLQHHLFDTLYHAVALETPGAVYVTADERYLAKAMALGAIRPLRDGLAVI